MSFPSFATGEVLTAADMNAVGLWLVKTVTVGTGVASVPVTDAFSADYDNYRIIISGGQTSVNGSIALQLNNSTGTTYQIYGYFGNFGAATLNGYGPAAGVRWTDPILGATSRYHAVIDLIGPFLTQQTFGYTNSATTVGAYNFSLVDTASVSNTGFTLQPLSGTMTGGTIRIYGYRK
jgi:hypothetical protein